MRYEEALKIRPESAIAALEIEVDNFECKGVWYGEHLENLTPAQRDLILDTMKNFKEEFLPTWAHEKDKIRFLSRGDKQQLDMLGETSVSVCRVVSIFLLACIAILKDYIMFKIDLVAAFLNAKIPEEVKHEVSRS
jgi:hypothetical protein